MHSFKTRVIVVVGLMLTLTLVAGCGSKSDATSTAEPTTTSSNQPPSARINAPAEGEVLGVGVPVQIDVTALDDQNVTSIELYVNNALLESRPLSAASAQTAVRELFTWTPNAPGDYLLQARSYDKQGLVGTSPAVTVQVGGESLPSPTSAEPPPASPQPSATTVPATSTPPPPEAQVTAKTDANVRNGPGLAYPVVGGLNNGESAPVVGRNADSSWWQISFEGGTAWIADIVVNANSEAYNAPVASAPPPPPTNTPVPVTPTPTQPAASATPTNGFWADRTSINKGECTTLRWSFSDIKAIYINLGSGEQATVGTGSEQVCPTGTTTYYIRIVKQDDSSQTFSVTVNVVGGNGSSSNFYADQTNLKAGQCTTLHWNFSDIKAIYIDFGYGEEGVGGQSSRQVCPSISTTYKARVINQDDSTSNYSVTINVSGTGCGDPILNRFEATTYNVAPGEPLTIFWDVECVQALYFIEGTGSPQPISSPGNKEVRPGQTTVYQLKMVKMNGGEMYVSLTVQVQ